MVTVPLRQRAFPPFGAPVMVGLDDRPSAHEWLFCAIVVWSARRDVADAPLARSMRNQREAGQGHGLKGMAS